MIKINLLPVREERKKESARQIISIGALSLVLVLIVIVISHVGVSRKITKLNTDIEKTQVEISRLDKIVGDIKKYEKKKKDLQAKIKIISLLSQKKAGPVHMLDELSKGTPGKVWFNSLKENDLKLALDGIALDNETVAVLMRSLERSPSFSDVELIQSQQHILRELKFRKFNITCQVVLPDKK